MDYTYKEHKDAYHLLTTRYSQQFAEVINVINKTSDEDIKKVFTERRNIAERANQKKDKSLSDTINQIFKNSFKNYGWIDEPNIFNASGYRKKNWRLDFAKKDISIEVATFRKDMQYNDGRHPEEVVYTKHVEEDIERRDFTVNGLVLDPETSQIFDYCEGIKDIESKIIRGEDSKLLLNKLLE